MNKISKLFSENGLVASEELQMDDFFDGYRKRSFVSLKIMENFGVEWEFLSKEIKQEVQALYEADYYQMLKQKIKKANQQAAALKVYCNLLSDLEKSPTSAVGWCVKHHGFKSTLKAIFKCFINKYLIKS